VKSTTLPRCIGVEGEQEEAFLDRREPLQALGARIVVRRDEDAEVELGYRYGADRDFVQRIRMALDQDRGVGSGERTPDLPLNKAVLDCMSPGPGQMPDAASLSRRTQL
jgi:hypothetical protein